MGMSDAVEIRQVPAQPIAILRGRTSMAALPQRIRALFNEFYAGFQGKGGLNIVFYPTFSATEEFDIECGVQVEDGGNSATPAGTVATVVHFGPYDRLAQTHATLHQWARANGHRLAGPSWELYGHWSDDPAKLRTDIFYLLS